MPVYFLWGCRFETSVPKKDLLGILKTVNIDSMQLSRPCSPARKRLRMMVLMRCGVSCVGSCDRVGAVGSSQVPAGSPGDAAGLPG